MRFAPAWRGAPALLLIAATGACAATPAHRQQGSVEIPLLATDALGNRHRLHGELIFSGVDNGVVRSVSTRTERASEPLAVRLPAGRYTLTLNAELVVESLAPCSLDTRARRAAWVNPVQPPIIDVTDGHVARVRFDSVATDPPRPRARSSRWQRREALPGCVSDARRELGPRHDLLEHSSSPNHPTNQDRTHASKS